MTIVKSGLIQVGLKGNTDMTPEQIRDAMLEAHIPFIDEAGKQGVQVLCLQEVFTQPYFCPSQDTKWYAAAEKIPDGYTTKLMQEYAKKHSMVIVVPIYEEEMTGVYYNTAAVIDADGTYLGKYRKTHIPQVAGFYEKFFFKPRAIRLAGIRHGVSETRGLYLLRPPFPRGLAGARPKRGGVYRQPVGDRRRLEPIYVEAGTAGLGGCQRRLYRGHQPAGNRGPVEYRALLWLQLYRRSAWRVYLRGERGQGRADRRRHGYGPGSRGSRSLAVFPRPAA